jgi:hypothetical protein
MLKVSELGIAHVLAIRTVETSGKSFFFTLLFTLALPLIVLEIVLNTPCSDGALIAS